jgi:hypothetical protein
MSKSPALLRAAEKLSIPYVEIPLNRGTHKNWTCPHSGRLLSVEEAALAHFRMDGWRGYSGEGGLLLNLIKAMSFKNVAPRNRATYIEALYAQNIAFSEDRFSVASMLEQVANADQHVVETNFDLMASSDMLVMQNGGFSSTSSTRCSTSFRVSSDGCSRNCLQWPGMG